MTQIFQFVKQHTTLFEYNYLLKVSLAIIVYENGHVGASIIRFAFYNLLLEYHITYSCENYALNIEMVCNSLDVSPLSPMATV